MYIAPINLANALWNHSQKYITLNSFSVIALFINLNSSMSLYLSNSWLQALLVKGNKIPDIGSHSVIDKPESDILVYPPIKIIDITQAKRVMSQSENRLILFPSWLKHNVQPNLNSKKERISISFNLA